MKTQYYRDKKGQFAFDPAKRSKIALDELYRAFDFFNKKFTDGMLPKVIITIQEAGRRNATGWFGNKFWTDNTCGQGVSEINLSAEWLSRNPDDILETLLHEMAHLYNAVHGVRDCTSGQYHNKHFKRAAEMFGLKVHRLKNKGFARTSLDETSQQAIDELNPNRDALSSLKRRRIKQQRARRYVSLIVDIAYEDVIESGMKITGLSQKHFVQKAIDSYVSREVFPERVEDLVSNETVR